MTKTSMIVYVSSCTSTCMTRFLLSAWSNHVVVSSLITPDNSLIKRRRNPAIVRANISTSIRSPLDGPFSNVPTLPVHTRLFGATLSFRANSFGYCETLNFSEYLNKLVPCCSTRLSLWLNCSCTLDTSAVKSSLTGFAPYLKNSHALKPLQNHMCSLSFYS